MFNRLHQRGGRTLLERNRTKQIEAKMTELGKEIAIIRKELSLRPN